MRASFLHTFKFVAGAVLALGVILSSGNVMAACTNPAGSAADMVYNGDQHVVQYCDGTNWIEAGVYGAGGTANCTNPAGSPGTIVFNADYGQMQYCNGSVWVAMAPEFNDTRGLVGHWKLDDGSGTTATDSSGFGNDGTLSGDPTWISGQDGGALSFDGTGDVVDAGDVEALDGVSQFTLSAWMRRSALNARVSISKGAAPCTNARGINMWGDGNVYLDAEDGVTANQHAFFVSNDTNWHHITMVYDGTQTGNANRMKGYVDGVPQTLSFGAGGMPASITSDSASFFIGEVECQNVKSNGDIDDVRLYNRPLTDSEVAALFKSQSGVTSDYTTNMVGRWKLDESSGTTAADSSGNGFDGTLYNSPTWNSTGGIMKGALLFVDDNLTYVDIPYSATLAPTAAITYSAWVYMLSHAGSDYERIVHYRRDYQDLRIYPSGEAAFRLRINGVNYTVKTVDSLSLNTWHHVVGTYDGSELAIYLDGNKKESVSVTGTIDSYSSSFNTVIGRDTSMSNVGETFDGYIDDVRVYNAGLTAAQVRQIYFYRELSNCTNPAANAGEFRYNSDIDVLQYCSGAEWIAIGK